MVYFTASILMMLMLVDQILAVSDCHIGSGSGVGDCDQIISYCNIPSGSTVGNCLGGQITSQFRITGDVTNVQTL